MTARDFGKVTVLMGARRTRRAKPGRAGARAAQALTCAGKVAHE